MFFLVIEFIFFLSVLVKLHINIVCCVETYDDVARPDQVDTCL